LYKGLNQDEITSRNEHNQLSCKWWHQRGIG